MEKKTNFGKALVLLAFVFVLLTIGSFNTICALTLVGLAIYFVQTGAQGYAKDTLEALYILVLNGGIRFVLGLFRDVLAQIIVWANGNPTALYDIFGVLFFLISIAFIVALVPAIIKVASNKPAKTLFVSDLAEKTLKLNADKED